MADPLHEIGAIETRGLHIDQDVSRSDLGFCDVAKSKCLVGINVDGIHQWRPFVCPIASRNPIDRTISSCDEPAFRVLARLRTPPGSCLRYLRWRGRDDTMSTLEPTLGVLVLNRMGFGPRPGDLDAFNGLGDSDTARLEAYIDRQLKPDALDDADVDARVAAANFLSLDQSRQNSWRNFVRREDEESSADLPLQELRRLTTLRAIYSNRQLVEVLADFWHNHFNVHGDQGVVYSMIMRYDRDVIRPNVLGNFRVMLGAVAESTCMLYYLDNYLSTDSGPNENWARELLELHTLGAEHYLGAGLLQSEVEVDADGQPVGYVDDDVYEATRAFTGWTVARDEERDTGDFLYVRDNHDRFQKKVVGKFLEADQPDLADGNDVLDVLAAHRGTAVHVCRKLCRRLVSDEPSEELVNAAADVFGGAIDADDQIAQTLRYILSSDEFRGSFGAKVKRPFEYTVGFLRQTGVDIGFGPDDEDGNALLQSYRELGQTLFDWPSPDGYADTAGYWLNTNSIFKSWRLANQALASTTEDQWTIDLDGPVPDDVRSSVELVDFWINRILGFELPDETRTPLIEFMAAGFDATLDLPNDDDTEERRRALVALIFMSPEYLWR